MRQLFSQIKVKINELTEKDDQKEKDDLSGLVEKLACCKDADSFKNVFESLNQNEKQFAIYKWKSKKGKEQSLLNKASDNNNLEIVKTILDFVNETVKYYMLYLISSFHLSSIFIPFFMQTDNKSPKCKTN